MVTRIPRSAYAGMFGPTVGDKVRLADTDIIIEVEKDFTAQPPSGHDPKLVGSGYSANTPLYGEEVKFGGGKVIRDGMGQSQVTNAEGAVDTVITNALILDHRSEEHTSELQSLMSISYAVFCLKKQN